MRHAYHVRWSSLPTRWPVVLRLPSGRRQEPETEAALPTEAKGKVSQGLKFFLIQYYFIFIPDMIVSIKYNVVYIFIIAVLLSQEGIKLETRQRTTKKVNCPAEIYISHVVKFPQHQVRNCLVTHCGYFNYIMMFNSSCFFNCLVTHCGYFNYIMMFYSSCFFTCSVSQ